MIFAVLALAAPLWLAAVALSGLTQPGRFPRQVISLITPAGIVSVLTAIVCAIGVAVAGPASSPLFGVPGVMVPGVGPLDLGLQIRLDALSVSMFVLVAILGAVILRFSRQYLDGDARHGAFLGRLAATIASVMLLVLAGTVEHFVIAWIATSLALHGLLLFYRDRRGAVLAARKKFILARVGDAALIAAGVLLVRAFGTNDIALLAERAQAISGDLTSLSSLPAGVPLAALLLVAAAALKSAAFPTHGWLLEVMETPTPVSALLHAGVLNGGPFLVLRFAAIVSLFAPAGWLLIVLGATTAVLASLVMITQSRIKTALAWSSAAHMGFTLLLCGLGVWPMALLHLIAHSFYKAHAFLSSGSGVDAVRLAQVPGHTPTLSGGRIATAFAVAIAMAAVVGTATGALARGDVVSIGLAAMLALGMVPLFAHGLETGSSLLIARRTIIGASVAALAFFGFELGATALTRGALPAEPPRDAVTLTLLALVLLAFAGVIAFQLLLPRLQQSPQFAALYVHVRNGFYANARFDALLGAWRHRPSTLITQEVR